MTVRLLSLLFLAACLPAVPFVDAGKGTLDDDGDGFTPDEGDCDDGDPAVSPSNTDIAGDGIDQNCDGVDGTDADGDGWAGVSSGGDDCDDTDANVHPDAEETWYDGVDQDCSGDDDLDADGDGYDSEAHGGEDCDDTDATAHPGADEDLDDAVDQDCDGIAQQDLDHDGWTSEQTGGQDCDDSDADSWPGAYDRPNDSIDQDCDGADSEHDGVVLAEGEEATSEFTATISLLLDVALLIDTTGSMGSAFSSEQFDELADTVALELPEVQYGLASFDDYAYSSYGYSSSGDLPFSLRQQVTDDLDAVSAAVGELSTHYGGDAAESSMEAIRQALTGTGYDQDCDGTVDSDTDVLPFLASAGDPFGGAGGESWDPTGSGGGSVGGMGFRTGAVPVVAYLTDNYMRDPDAGYGTPGGCPDEAGTEAVLAAAEETGAYLVGMAYNSSTYPAAQMEDLALATASTADLDGDGDGSDPLVLNVSASNVGASLASALTAIGGPQVFEAVTLEVEGDDYGLVAGISPETYEDVDRTLVDELTFTVAWSGTAPATSEEQEFVLTFRVVGDGWTLATWQVTVLVPPA